MFFVAKFSLFFLLILIPLTDGICDLNLNSVTMKADYQLKLEHFNYYYP